MHVWKKVGVTAVGLWDFACKVKGVPLTLNLMQAAVQPLQHEALAPRATGWFGPGQCVCAEGVWESGVCGEALHCAESVCLSNVRERD